MGQCCIYIVGMEKVGEGILVDIGIKKMMFEFEASVGIVKLISVRFASNVQSLDSIASEIRI